VTDHPSLEAAADAAVAEHTPPVTASGLVIPAAGASLEEAVSVAGPPCSKCGLPMPPLDEELLKLARRHGSVALSHEVCPGQEPAAETGRYFEVRVQVVEIREIEQFGEKDVVADEMITFVAGLRAENLDAAMRPLALKLGEKWQDAEKQANIADADAVGLE
jgi:hypothetical protein